MEATPRMTSSFLKDINNKPSDHKSNNCQCIIPKIIEKNIE